MTLAFISWEVDPHREFMGIHYMPHGVLIAVGFIAGSLLLVRYAARRGYRTEVIWDMLTWALVGSLIGMRIAWLAGHVDEIDSMVDVIAVWRGGMSLFGGIFGGIVAGAIKAHRSGLAPLPLLDLAMPGLALGIAVGRISDLIIGDHLGKPTDLPWGFRYVGTDAPGVSLAIGDVVHPVALYDLLSTLVLFAVLVVFLRQEGRALGSATALFALWYASGRLLLDFLRVDPEELWACPVRNWHRSS